MHRLKRQGIEHPKTLAFTSIAQFNNGLTFQTAAITGTFLYSGPIAASSRLFCREHVGKVFTLEQIGQMDNGQGLPVLTSCGGYNCRHEWVAEPDGSARQGLKTVEIGKMTLLLSPSESQTLLSKVAKHTA